MQSIPITLNSQADSIGRRGVAVLRRMWAFEHAAHYADAHALWPELNLTALLVPLDG